MPLARIGYDAERDIGVIAEDDSLAVAVQNRNLVNAALLGMHPINRFTFTDRSSQNVLFPIYFSGKEFFFDGVIETAKTMGGGIIGAFRNKSYPYPSNSYNYEFGAGGGVTRFTQINGNDYRSQLSLAGNGFLVEGIEFRARPYMSDGTGEGPTTGYRTPVGIEIQGNNTHIASGGHTIRNCSFMDHTYGISAIAGYYTNGIYTADENHADNILIDNCLFWGNDSCLHSVNQQAVCWTIHNPHVSCFGGAGLRPTVICDIVRGGDWHITGNAEIAHRQVTLFQTTEWSPYQSNFSCQNFKWDRFTGPEDYYFTVYKHAGPAFADSSFTTWTGNIVGHLADDVGGPYWDVSKLIQIPDGAINFPLDDIWFKIKNMPHTNMTQVGNYWRADSYTDWTY